MADYLQSLLKKKLEGLDYSSPSYSNEYDDGSVWDEPVSTPTVPDSSHDDYSSMIKNLMPNVYGDYMANYHNQDIAKQKEQINEIKSQDELNAPRNQVNYYSKQLEQAGEEPAKPSILERATSGALKALEGITLIPAAVDNFIAGGANEQVKNRDNAEKNKEDVQKAIDNKYGEDSWQSTANNVFNVFSKAAKGNGFLSMLMPDGYDVTKQDDEGFKTKTVKEVLSDAANIPKGAIDSGASTIKSFTDESERKNVKSFGDVYRTMLNGKSDEYQNIGETIAKTANPVYHIAKAMGADEDKATEYGLIGADVATGLAIPMFGESGNALKYIRNIEDVKNAEKIGGDINKATKLAKESNSIDDYEKVLKNSNPDVNFNTEDIQKSYDNYIDTIAQKNIQQTTKALGGMPNFNGLTLSGKTILSRDTLDKLASNKVSNALTQTGLGLYSPVSAFMHNPITEKVSSKLGDTKIGTAVKETVEDKFVNPYKTAMRNDNDKALEYGNSMINEKNGQKILKESIANDIDQIKKYSEQPNQNPTNITNTVEDVKTKYNETSTPMEVINDDYANIAQKYTRGNYYDLQKDLGTKSKSLDEQITNLEKQGIDTSDLQNQKTNLQKVNDD